MRIKTIDKARDFIIKKKIKFISKSKYREVWECDDKEVIFTKKAGRTVSSCSCQNYARFCNENPECSHKIAVNFVRVFRWGNGLQRKSI